MGEISDVQHPFFPLDAKIVGYLANDLSVTSLIGAFALGCFFVLGASLLLVRRRSVRLSGVDEVIVLWFVLSMFTQGLVDIT